MVLKNLLIDIGVLRLRKKLSLIIGETFFSYRIDAQLDQFVPLLIYQMGKVGSHSIYYSLKKVYPGLVLHNHTFSFDDRDWRVRKLHHHCVVKKKPLNIISLTREPIGRNISAFFHNFKRDTGVSYLKSNFSLEELKRLFLDNYNHDIPLDWFDKHIKSEFGIDVYEKPFPLIGWATYTHKNARLLVIRSEIEDSAKISAIKKFLDLPIFELKRKNVGENKLYAETYQAFKNKIHLPSEYVNKMCDSKYISHFYTKNFVDSLRQKWVGP
jgi:hypothetical protein